MLEDKKKRELEIKKMFYQVSPVNNKKKGKSEVNSGNNSLIVSKKSIEEPCCDIGKTRGLYAGDDFYLIYDKGENWQIRQFDMKKGFAPVKALDLTSK